MSKPTVAVYKFSSCDGCQLSILNLEDELLDLAGAVEIAYFLEARRRTLPGPYDIGLVEGSVTTPHEVEKILEIRSQVRHLVALGTCATAGGIQALRNFTEVGDLAMKVYEYPEYLDVLAQATPIAQHVKVDFDLWGCPVNKYQVVEVILSLLQSRKPMLPAHSVCLDCKRKGTVCVEVAMGIPCLGPITRTGCGAICPAYGRGCYGCFGPAPNAEHQTYARLLKSIERYPGEAMHLLRNIAGYSPNFRAAAAVIEVLEAEG
jgi:coenzyme F420-reducing hydrogenase gamma subunit